MKASLLLAIAITPALFCACDVKVNNPPAEKKVEEKNTTIVNPPAKEEKKVENNTTIVNPPPKEEKKTEINVNPPAQPPPK
jgi:hypothetical protein